MKKTVLTLLCIVALLGSVIGGAAQEDRTLPITFSRHMGEGASGAWELGENCPAAPEFGDRPFTLIGSGETQVIVRNEDDRIIAMVDVPDGIVQEGVVDEDDWTCKADLKLSLPEASFYMVYLDEFFVRGYAASQFPIEDGDTLYISFTS